MFSLINIPFKQYIFTTQNIKSLLSKSHTVHIDENATIIYHSSTLKSDRQNCIEISILQLFFSVFWGIRFGRIVFQKAMHTRQPQTNTQTRVNTSGGVNTAEGGLRSTGQQHNNNHVNQKWTTRATQWPGQVYSA